MEKQEIQTIAEQIKQNIQKVIVGKDETIDELVLTLQKLMK